MPIGSMGPAKIGSVSAVGPSGSRLVATRPIRKNSDHKVDGQCYTDTCADFLNLCVAILAGFGVGTALVAMSRSFMTMITVHTSQRAVPSAVSPLPLLQHLSNERCGSLRINTLKT